MTPPTNSKEYWPALKQAHGLVNTYRRLYAETKRQPLYIGYDKDGVPIENIEPFDRLDEATKALKANKWAHHIALGLRIKGIA